MHTLGTLNITVDVPAVQGFFGERLASYTTQISPLQLKRILGHDPRSKHWKLLPENTRAIYERIQRSTSLARSESIIGYIEQRFGQRHSIGAFPGISIGITKATNFKNFPELGSNKHFLALGELQIEEDCERIILDGLGRSSSCLDLAEESEAGLELVKQIVFPVTFYLPAPGTDPLSVDELGQLFMDFNFRVHKVSANIAIALDQSDIYISLANQLAKESFIKNNGGMESKAASRGKKSTALVVQGVLVRTVRGACEGRDFQESNLAISSNPNLTEQTFQAELASISRYFTEISTRMGDRWRAHESLHLTAPGWQALGVIHHDIHHRGITLTALEMTHIYDVIAGLDWSRSNRAWADDAGLGVWTTPKPRKGQSAEQQSEQVVILGAGRNNAQAIIDYLRHVTGIESKLGHRELVAI